MADTIQGRIVTQNSALLSMLRERTMENDQQMRRVYVDSPVFSPDDEEKYKYVSTEVDNFDPDHEEALLNTRSHRGGDTYRGGPPNANSERQGFALHPAISEQDDDTYVAPSYKDNKVKKRGDNPKPVYVVRGGQEPQEAQPPPAHERNNSLPAQRSPEKPISSQTLSPDKAPNSAHSVPKVITPIKTPFRASSEDEKREEQELEQEYRYQRHLKSRIDEVDQETQRIHIPKLDLTEEAETRLPQDSLDFHLDDDDYGVKDSIDGVPRDSLDWGNPPPNPYHESDPRWNQQKEKDLVNLSRKLDLNDPSTYEQQIEELQRQQKQHEQQLYMLQQAQAKNAAPTVREQDSRLQQMFTPHKSVGISSSDYKNMQGGQVSNSQEGVHGYTDTKQPPVYEINLQLPMPAQGVEPQGFVQPKINVRPQIQDGYANQQEYYDYEQNGYQQTQGIPQSHLNEDDYYAQYEAEMAQNQQQMSDRNKGPHQYVEEPDDEYDDRRGSSKAQSMVPNKPSEDYLSKNKEIAVNPNAKKKSYGKIRDTRKEIKKFAPPPIVPKVKSNSSQEKAKKPPPAPVKPPVSHYEIDDSEDGDSTANMWSKRASNLAIHKERSSGKHVRTKPLRKYPSASRVDDVNREQQNVTNNNPMAPRSMAVVPAGYVPSPRQTMAEPIRSEVVYDPRVSPQHGGQQPMRHTVLTDDGQRVSVDINLKMVSPPPGSNTPMGHGQPRPQYRPQMFAVPQAPHVQAMMPISQLQRPPRPMQAFQEQGFRPHVPQQQPMHNGYSYQQGDYPDPHNQYGNPPQNNYGNQPPQQYYGNQQQQSYGNQPRHQYGNQPPLSPSSSHQFYNELPQKSPTPTMSPYSVVPPIDSYTGQEMQYQQPQTEDVPNAGGSYMQQYQKTSNRKYQYKEYNLKDYRKFKKEVRLGSLGPDLDNETLKERREKTQKQMDYARMVKERNNKQLANKKPVSNTRLITNDDLEQAKEKRSAALEYSRSVPKPKVVPRPLPIDVPASPGGRSTGRSTSQSQRNKSNSVINPKPTIAARPRDPNPDPELEMIDLQKLQERHEAERQKAAMIKQNMQVS